MSKTAIVTTRVDPKLKADVEEVFEQLGLTTSQAVTMFLKQVDLQKGLPFSVKIPEKPKPKFGSAKGLIEIGDDFDDPIEGFEEYMP